MRFPQGTGEYFHNHWRREYDGKIRGRLQPNGGLLRFAPSPPGNGRKGELREDSEPHTRTPQAGEGPSENALDRGLSGGEL